MTVSIQPAGSVLRLSDEAAQHMYSGTMPLQNVFGAVSLWKTAYNLVDSASTSWVDLEIKRLSKLEDNWDGYGAERLNVQDLSAIRDLLIDYLPDDSVEGGIIPGADGSLQAEWHFATFSVGVRREPSGDIECWFHEGDQELERSGPAALELFAGIASIKLSRAHSR